jgi:hypothetical protein
MNNKYPEVKMVVYNYTKQRDKETAQDGLDVLKELGIEVFQ